MGMLESFIQPFTLVCTVENIHKTEKDNLKHDPRLSMLRFHLRPEFLPQYVHWEF